LDDEIWNFSSDCNPRAGTLVLGAEPGACGNASRTRGVSGNRSTCGLSGTRGTRVVSGACVARAAGRSAK